MLAILQFGLDIGDAQPLTVGGDKLQAVRMDITGHDLAVILHQLRHMGGLAARRTAHVQHPLPRLRRCRPADVHRAFILHGKAAFLEKRQFMQIDWTVDAQSFGNMGAGCCRDALRFKFLGQRFQCHLEGIHPDPQRRWCIEILAQCFGFFEAICSVPSLDDPLWERISHG